MNYTLYSLRSQLPPGPKGSWLYSLSQSPQGGFDA